MVYKSLVSSLCPFIALLFAVIIINVQAALAQPANTEFITSPEALEKANEAEVSVALEDFESAKADLKRQLDDLENQKRELEEQKKALQDQQKSLTGEAGIEMVDKIEDIEPTVEDRAAKNFGEAPPQKKMTRVRVDGRPTVSWQGNEITSIICTVRNVGTVTAEGIQVSAALPGGRQITLSGPSTLEPNKKVQFMSEKGEEVSSAGEVRINPTCANCWR